MQSGKLTLRHRRTDTLLLPFRARIKGVNWNFAGYTAQFKIVSSAGATIATLTSGAGDIVLGDGTITVTVAASVVSGWTNGEYTGSLSVTYPNGTVKTLAVVTLVLEG